MYEYGGMDVRVSFSLSHGVLWRRGFLSSVWVSVLGGGLSDLIFFTHP